MQSSILGARGHAISAAGLSLPMLRTLLVALALLLVAPWSPPAHAETLRVPNDYESIQEALDLALEGDTVLVAAGTYYENLHFPGVALTLESEEGAEKTIIDGSKETLGSEYSSVVTLDRGEGQDTILRGFTLQNGAQRGVFCKGSSPVISDCIVLDNGGDGMVFCDSSGLLDRVTVTSVNGTATSGVYAYGTLALTMRECTIIENTASFGVGGMAYVPDTRSTLTMEGCVFTQNNVGLGAGALVVDNTDVTMRGCVIEGNWVKEAGIGGIGASVCSIQIEDCVFQSNRGTAGAALMIDDSASTSIARSLFSNNDGDESAGAVRIERTPSPATAKSLLSFEQCTFFRNSGAGGSIVDFGFYRDSAPSQSDAFFTSCILWNNGDTLFDVSEGDVSISYSAVEGGYVGDGNIDADPLFIDADSGNFRLLPDSPCIDAGDPDSPLDPDGTTADMGPFYFSQIEMLRGDVDANGTVAPLTDAVSLLGWQFLSGAEPPCMDAADLDDSGSVAALLDAVYLLRWAFAAGPDPADPGTEDCGFDPTSEELDCGTPPECD